MTSDVHVDLGENSYSIKIGNGFIKKLPIFLNPVLKRKKVAIVTDTNVEKLYLSKVTSSLVEGGIDVISLSLNPGEMSKDWLNLKLVVDWILENKLERDDFVLALGGGVIGDLVGFAASIVRRGIRCVQLPTTLLAQVDSSVGGKTGINSKFGKNLIGSFYHPKLVLIDVDLLSTQTHRELMSGFGEVIKYGLLGNHSFFEWLETNGKKVLNGDKTSLIKVISTCCKMKAEIVARDEKENGERALLNLGHTFGHSLETATGYSDRLLHGEGVSIGCCLAFDLSYRLGICSQEEPSRIRSFMKSHNMMTDIWQISGDTLKSTDLIELMKQDKKVRDGNLRFIIPNSIGSTFVADGIDVDLVREVIDISSEKP